jgi:hypothetical protein
VKKVPPKRRHLFTTIPCITFRMAVTFINISSAIIRLHKHENLRNENIEVKCIFLLDCVWILCDSIGADWHILKCYAKSGLFLVIVGFLVPGTRAAVSRLSSHPRNIKRRHSLPLLSLYCLSILRRVILVAYLFFSTYSENVYAKLSV